MVSFTQQAAIIRADHLPPREPLGDLRPLELLAARHQQRRQQPHGAQKLHHAVQRHGKRAAAAATAGRGVHRVVIFIARQHGGDAIAVGPAARSAPLSGPAARLLLGHERHGLVRGAVLQAVANVSQGELQVVGDGRAHQEVGIALVHGLDVLAVLHRLREQQ